MSPLQKMGGKEPAETKAVDPPKKEKPVSEDLGPGLPINNPDDRVTALEAKIGLLTEMLSTQGLAPKTMPVLDRGSFGSARSELPYIVDTRAKDMGSHKDESGKDRATSANFILIDNEGDLTVIIENAEAIRLGDSIVRDESTGRRLKFFVGRYNTQSKSVAQYLIDHRMYGIMWTIDPEDTGRYWRDRGLVKERQEVVTSIDRAGVSESRKVIQPQPSTSA